MRSAFTMIELIFVMVVLGILTALALPKLAATRADAKASALAYSIAIASTDIVSYVVARGPVEDDLSLMSSSISMLVNSNKATLDVGNKKVVIKADEVDCITMQIVALGSNEALDITFQNTGTNSTCDITQSLTNIVGYPLQLGGTSVSH